MAGILAAILAKKKPGMDEGDDEESSESESEKAKEHGATLRAAKSLMSAIKSDDAEEVASAFKRLHDICAESPEADYEEGE